MNTPLEHLEQQFERIARLDHALTFLGWDQMVMMPVGGAEPRAAAMAELSGMRHALLTDAAMGDWLNEAAAKQVQGDDASTRQWQAANLREMHRSWQQASALPATLVKAKVLAGSRCEHGWRTQRAANDWTGFLANFREVVALAREEAELRQSLAPERFATPYDALLDLHCAGDTEALIGTVFDTLREQLPPLMHRIMEKQATESTPPIGGHFPVEQQRRLSERLMSRLGFDFSAGRLDVSLHPFSTGVRGDQRITTRYREDEFADALQATAHETGHASYEAGLPSEFSHLPVGRARNMCIHESQSLLFEKHLFMSSHFLSNFIDDVKAELADAASLTPAALWHSQTRVAPSFIRVEADEVTYPLHVMLRYEIESALINRDIEADVIPDVWDAAMQRYLGLSTAGNHADGCLQDIHWTDGAFGYFPSYTLGAVNAAQLMHSLRQAQPDIDAQLSAGNTESLREWLSAHIWSQASLHESQDIMTAATGEGSSPAHLLSHLEARYLDERW